MQSIFEAKYLAIEWYDKNTVSNIVESQNKITVEVQNKSHYNMEIQAYKRLENGYDGQVGFHILDNVNDVQPYFKNANGDKVNLLRIIDPYNKKIWWIEDGNWSKKYKYRMSELWNHSGETTVYFGNIICDIDISATSFTKKQLELYLEDFKNDFWYLILKKDSLTQADARNNNEQIKILNKEIIENIKNFVKYIEDILKSPKKELKETQNLKDLKKVKPIAKTFREIATSGIRRKLTSRDTIESFNVPENKYMHYALSQVYYIVFNITKASKHINSFYKNKAKSKQQRIDNFKDTKTVDKETIENSINQLQERINNIQIVLKNIEDLQKEDIKKHCEHEISKLTIQDTINNSIKNQSTFKVNENQLQSFYIKLERRQENFQNKIQFWGKIRNFNEENWHGTGTSDLFSLEFDLNLFEFLKETQEFIITATTLYSNRQTNSNRNMHKIYFQYITKLKLLNSKEPIQTIKYQTLHIKLNKKQKSFEGKIQFWGKVRLATDQEWYQFKQGDSLSLEFDYDILNHVLLENTEYEISAFVEKSEFKKSNGGIVHKRNFKYIKKIVQKTNFQLDKELNYYINQKEQLKQTNWTRPLSVQERREQEQEKMAIQKQIDDLNRETQNDNKYIKQIEPLIFDLKNLLIQFEKLSISKDSYFPNSMTFVQNPHYQGGYNYFNLIKDSIGVNEELFLSILKVDKIGILDIPTLYERWCFLQIIKVLIDTYNFLPEVNWKQKLLLQMIGEKDEVRKNIKNISIKFTNSKLERNIKLHYEKVLNNKKRPDFIIEIDSLRTKKKHNLIMDAKFKEDVKIKDLIEELYHYKNYSEDNKNTVFILHPDTKKSIKKMNPSEWGNDAYYGEVQMFNYKWDNNEFPNHKYGSILLTPITNSDLSLSGNYLDNLQRLIGMTMQYQLEENQNIRKNSHSIDPEPLEKIFCIQCGNINFNGKKNPTRNSRGFRYNLTCTNCSHTYIYNYCWNCKSRLIKNGLYWSYHAAQVLEPYNIKCPNCNHVYIREEN